MPCPRPLLAALLALSPCLACIENTIAIESAEGSGSAADEGSTATTADPSASVTITTTTSTTTATSSTVTTVGPPDSSDTADVDVDSGPRLDFEIEPESETLLWAVDTVVAAGLPLQGIVWLERGGGTVSLQLQWLSLEVGSTTQPRELVGDVYAYSGIPLDPDGSFTWDTGVILVPGEANPITGSDITGSFSVDVEPAGSPYCGSVGGQVLSPIQVSLDGSTHAMTTVPAVDALPLEFPTSCP